MSRCVTIYTDASVNFEKTTGGWACWIKFGAGETALYSGALKSDVSCVNEAELMAIANGIVAAKKMVGDQVPIFVVVTDSAVAIEYIGQARKRTTSEPAFKQRKLKAPLFDLAKTVLSLVPDGSDLRVNKVKAHCYTDGARSYVNNQVDKAARTAMRKARSA